MLRNIQEKTMAGFYTQS